VAQIVKRGKSWYYRFTDANGRRIMRKGCPDRRMTEGIAAQAEAEVARIKSGLSDPREEGYAKHAAVSLADHWNAWKASLRAKNSTEKHVTLFSVRAARVIALASGAKLSDIESPRSAKKAEIARTDDALEKCLSLSKLMDLTSERVEQALSKLRVGGRSLATLNHHRAAIRAFSKWCDETHRNRYDNLRLLKSFNAKEDPRHDRRTVSLEELRRLVQVAQSGPIVMGMAGPARALCYRLAVATGLRYSEISIITPESFNWQAPSVTVAAAYTKNGDPATFSLSSDLADDLAAYVSTLPPGKPVFPLPVDKGAKMLRYDLKAAKIPYRDGGGLVFDFHSLRCEMATLADAAGVSPRVVQKMMRHSTLELTGRYTRPRAVDIEAAASKLPSLKPDSQSPESIAATGTDGAIHQKTFAPSLRPDGDTSVRIHAVLGDLGGVEVEAPCDVKNVALPMISSSLPPDLISTGDGTRTHDLRIMRPPL
jgi:integrase